jgi:hypothetical protein
LGQYLLAQSTDPFDSVDELQYKVYILFRYGRAQNHGNQKKLEAMSKKDIEIGIDCNNFWISIDEAPSRENSNILDSAGGGDFTYGQILHVTGQPKSVYGRLVLPRLHLHRRDGVWYTDDNPVDFEALGHALALRQAMTIPIPVLKEAIAEHERINAFLEDSIAS